MPFDVDRLLRLWIDPLPDGEAAESAFRELYYDPVSVNGEPIGAEELVTRARALQAALEWPNTRVLSVVDGGRRIAVVFRLRGRQIGPLTTSAGSLPPTGRVVELRIIDVLTLAGGRVREVWTVQNELGALAAVEAVELVSGNGVAAEMPLHRPPWTSEHAH